MPLEEDLRAADQAKAFVAAVAAVAEHNKQFSFGRAIVRALRLSMGQPDQLKWSDQQDVDRSILGFEVAESLACVGLAVSPVRGVATMISANSIETIGTVRLQMQDGGKFVDFLDRAVGRSQTGSDFSEAVNAVASDLCTEVSQALVTDDGPLVSEGLAYAQSLAAAMSRLGLASSPAAVELRELSTHARAGCGAEFIRAKNVGLLDQPGPDGFNMSTWHQDARVKYLSDKWSEVVVTIIEIRGNPKASDFQISSLRLLLNIWNLLETIGQ